MNRVIVEDTRQQAGKHELKNQCWKDKNIDVVRCKLPFGDYAVMPDRTVDTKADILELCSDIDQQHERFKNECIGARDAGCKLYVLVENTDGIARLNDLANWVNPRAAINKNCKRQPPMTGARLLKACLTMQERYGVQFVFCTPEDAAKRVLEILEFDDEANGGQ